VMIVILLILKSFSHDSYAGGLRQPA
jgi:hypothetical protein